MGVIEVAVGVRHQAKNAPGWIAESGDARHAAIGVGRVPVVMSVGINVSQGDPAFLLELPCDAIRSRHHLSLRVLDGHFEMTPTTRYGRRTRRLRATARAEARGSGGSISGGSIARGREEHAVIGAYFEAHPASFKPGGIVEGNGDLLANCIT